MRSTATLSAVWCLLWPVTAVGQEGQIPQPPPTLNIPGVVAGGTKVQVIVVPQAPGVKFQSMEGPIGMPDGTFLFAQSSANLISKIDKDDKISTVVESTNAANGLALDSKGRLIGVQTKPGAARVAVLYPKGSEAVLTANYQGRPFNRPNDLVQ